MPTLTLEQLDAALAGLDGWNLEDGEIRKQFQFPDFVAALAFVNRVGAVAEVEQHHPDIDIRYNKVRLSLVTHDAGGVTNKDIVMARRIDSL
jgi:4a-hydroxytetrahydrobiopterin dehydratase